jgi:protein ImuB
MSRPLYLCLHVRDFPVHAELRVHPELRGHAVALLDGDPPLETVFSLNDQARRLGLAVGMSRVQAESFDSVSLRSRVKAQEDSAFSVLMQCVERFSPRVEVVASPTDSVSGATLVLDISACERLFGTPKQIAVALRRTADTAGFEASVATSMNAYAAVVAARGLSGITIVPAGNEAGVLAPLPLTVLELEPEQRETFVSWGIRTLGQLAGLPQTALVARIGEVGRQLQALSRGDCDHLLTPVEPAADAVLSESTELEHPVDLLEPLLFLISRMLDQIVRRAAARALAIAQVETKLVLDGPIRRDARREHRRIVRPALPEWSHQTLLKLIQLDLELHPPEAAVIALHLVALPARSQTVQQGLFTPQTPEAGRLEILLARLRKLVGEGRVGAAELLDSHCPEAFRMAPFVPDTSNTTRASVTQPRPSALRILRPPRAIRVEVHTSRLAALVLEGQKFVVHKDSGPWKASGAWWTYPDWSREEWDVALGGQDQDKDKKCCRIARDPASNCWYLIGIYD